jgi:hypothetical protein
MNPTEFDLDNYDPGAFVRDWDYIDPDNARDDWREMWDD